ncbi:MAG TPA: amidohydrolase family protein [Candidatus Lachnoclostridium avicola]|nr:amidohydrolase family protein [Candidatus Lachnoclostridium avicola]
MRQAIVHARILRETGQVTENGYVVFDESGILELGEGEYRGKDLDEKIDGEGKTLMPGLIDCHVHLGYGGLSPDTPEVEQGMAIAMQMREFLKYGITTVRSMGTKDDCDIKMRNLIASGYLTGPRIIASGQGMCITGGHGWPMNYECDTPDEAKKAARKAIYAGADILKMFATGGMATKGSIPNAPQMSEEQMRAVCREADRTGLLTGAHCTGIEGAQRAIRAGVRSIEHIPMDEETARMMKEHGCYYCPTIVTRYNIIHSTEPEYEHMRKKASPQDLEKKKAAIGLCLKYGIPICASTDSMGSLKNDGLTKMGESLVTELNIYHEYGLTNLQAIQSATSTAAEMLRLDQVTGRMKEGLQADLILVDGKPDEDLNALRNISMTVRGGTVLYKA